MAQPIQKYKVGQFELSIWPRQGKGGSTYYGFSLQKSWPRQDAQGQNVIDPQTQKVVYDKAQISIQPNDVSKIRMLLFKALHWLYFSNKPAPQPAQQPYGTQQPVKPATGPFGEDEIPI